MKTTFALAIAAALALGSTAYADEHGDKMKGEKSRMKKPDAQMSEKKRMEQMQKHQKKSGTEMGKKGAVMDDGKKKEK